MRKIIFIFIICAISSCSSRHMDDSLIVPPNFADMPDATNPEKPSEKQKEADIAKLKDLLLKSE